jgi:hypothetical protein
MAANFLLKCWFKAVGSEGPLIPSRERGPFGPMLVLRQMGILRSFPRGFGIDARLEFDLQDDCGVDQIECYERLGGGLNQGMIRARPGDKYFRMFIEPGERSRGNPNSNFIVERIDDVAHLRFTEGEVENQYLIGPGVTALAGDGKLRGIDVDLRGFMDKRQV